MSDFCTDVVIHIDEELDDDSIHDIERDLGEMDGVYCACVNERTRHLMLVDYDPLDVKAGSLLRRVENRGLHAELIGF